jgi:hypothetical protein
LVVVVVEGQELLVLQVVLAVVAVVPLIIPVIQEEVELLVKVMLEVLDFIIQEFKKLVVEAEVQEVQESMVDLQDH